MICSSHRNCRCAFINETLLNLYHVRHGRTSKKLGFSKIKLWHLNIKWKSPDVIEVVEGHMTRLKAEKRAICDACEPCNYGRMEAKCYEEIKQFNQQVISDVTQHADFKKIISYGFHHCTRECACADSVRRLCENYRDCDEARENSDSDRLAIAIRRLDITGKQLSQVCGSECSHCMDLTFQTQFRIRQNSFRMRIQRGFQESDGTEYCTETCVCAPKLRKILLMRITQTRTMNISYRCNMSFTQPTDPELIETCAGCADCIQARAATSAEPAATSSD